MSERPEALGETIAQAQDQIVDQLDATVAQRRARFVAAVRRERPRRNVVPWLAGAGALAAAAAVVLLWVGRQSPEKDPADATTPIASRHDAEEQSERDPAAPNVHQLAGGARIELVANADIDVPDQAQPRVRLRRGRVVLRTDEARGAPAAVEAGSYRIQGANAAASIHWDPEATTLDVEVSRGEVSIESVVVGTARTVVAGQSVHLDGVDADASPRMVPEPSTPDGGETDTEAAPRESTPRPTKKNPGWLSLAKAGKNAEAVAAAQAQGFSRILSSASAKDLLSLAKAARYGKAPARAKEAFAAVRTRFPKTQAAARAAYGLGRLAFDLDRKFGEAATWFRTYLTEQPSGALKREALGRLVESQRRSGATAAARRNAMRYLADYPDGPHADIARKAL